LDLIVAAACSLAPQAGGGTAISSIAATTYTPTYEDILAMGPLQEDPEDTHCLVTGVNYVKVEPHPTHLTNYGKLLGTLLFPGDSQWSGKPALFMAQLGLQTLLSFREQRVI
jgi:hypothetical protein